MPSQVATPWPVDTVLVHWKRALGAPDTEALREELFALAETGSPFLQLDFRGVEYLTAAGLGILVAVHTRLRDAGRRLVLCNVRPEVEEVLRVTRLNMILDVRQTREEAA